MSLKGSKTKENLEAAFAGESQANRRYLYFAQKADIEAVAEAIARVSVFADKNADVLDSIDVNPLLVLPEGEGAVALDGLIVTKE